MSLSLRCGYAFTGSIRTRGANYFAARRVERAVADGSRVHARVRGEQIYDVVVDLDAERGTLHLGCSCPFGGRDFCKHMWAVILHLDSLWPALEPPGRTRLEVRLGSGGSAPRVARGDPPAPAGGPGPVGSTTLAHWRELLASLAEPAGPPAMATSTAPLLEYHLDLERSRGRGAIAVRFFSRRGSGAAGAPVPARIGDQEIARAAPEDRSLLELLLRAARPSDDERYAVYRRYHGELTTDGAEIHAGMLDIVLPRLCASGRFGWRDGDALRPLAWDGGGPWRFTIQVAPRGARRTVTGALIRGGRRLELSRALLAHVGGVVIYPDTIVAVDLPAGTGPWMIAARTGGDLELAASDEIEFLRAACDSAGAVCLELDPALGWSRRQGQPVPRLRLQAPAARGTIGARLAFDYGGEVVDLDEPRSGFVDTARRALILRDREVERAWLDRLWEAGAQPARSEHPPRHAEVAWTGLHDLMTRLLAAGWRVEAEGKAIRAAGKVRLDVSSGVDWFELGGAARFGDVDLPLPALLAALRRGDRFVELGDGSQGMLPEEWLARFGLLSRLGRIEDGSLRFVRAQAGLLDALLADEPEVDVDAGFRKARAELKAFDGVRPIDAPRTFHGELRDYQRDGLGWLDFLVRFGFGGCLADDMGLGKTVQVLALLEARRTRRRPAGEKRQPSIVVVPRSLVFNWRDEATRFTPGLRVVEYVGPGRAALRPRLVDYDVVVTTYGTLRRDAELLAEIRFDHAILDEAQTIKNPDSQAARACRRLRADHRLALTGTPVENRLGDLASIFEFLNPGMMGGTGALAPLVDGQTGGAALATLARALRPFILRRTKEQVLSELPARTEQILHCELDGTQKALYAELREYYRASLAARVQRDGIGRSKIHVLEALLRLRQAACHPGLIDPERTGDSSAKLEVLLDHLAEVVAAGHKALVFSQFTSLLAIVRNRVEAAGMVYEYLDGRTRDRRRRVERFQQDPGCGLFLISLKAGGQGLNLTAADYVFLLDPWWNPAVEAQAIDRAHRIGQTRPVIAYRLIARDTIEDKVLALQASKRQLAEALMTSAAGPLADLTADDLQELLG